MTNRLTEEEEDAIAAELGAALDADEVHTEAKGAVQNVNSRIVGYHFAGLHFYPGVGGVKDVWVGDPVSPAFYQSRCCTGPPARGPASSPCRVHNSSLKRKS